MEQTSPETGEHAMTSQTLARTELKQETIAIVAVGLTILGTMLYTTNRLEARIDRVQIETRADIDRVQTETRADIDRVQTETRADIDRIQAEIRTNIERVQAEIRAEARADREVFTREILRLTAEQSRLAGIVDGPRAE